MVITGSPQPYIFSNKNRQLNLILPITSPYFCFKLIHFSSYFTNSPVARKFINDQPLINLWSTKKKNG